MIIPKMNEKYPCDITNLMILINIQLLEEVVINLKNNGANAR